MVDKIIQMLIGFIIINVGSFVRIQLIQRDTSWKEFKIYMIIFNVAYIIFAVLYLAGIIE